MKKVDLKYDFVESIVRQSCVHFAITVGYLGSADKSPRGV